MANGDLDALSVLSDQITLMVDQLSEMTGRLGRVEAGTQREREESFGKQNIRGGTSHESAKVQVTTLRHARRPQAYVLDYELDRENDSSSRSSRSSGPLVWGNPRGPGGAATHYDPADDHLGLDPVRDDRD